MGDVDRSRVAREMRRHARLHPPDSAQGRWYRAQAEIAELYVMWERTHQDG